MVTRGNADHGVQFDRPGLARRSSDRMYGSSGAQVCTPMAWKGLYAIGDG